jgi:cytochrome P450
MTLDTAATGSISALTSDLDLSITQPQTVPAHALRAADFSDVDFTAAISCRSGPPHAAFDAVRTGGGLVWHDEAPPQQNTVTAQSGTTTPPSPGFWMATSHDVVSEVSKDPVAYSSYLGGISVVNMDEMMLAGMRLMLLFMDPPDQTRLRRLLVPSFTPRSIDLMTEAVSVNTRELADAVAVAGARGATVDLVETVAKELPTRVLAVLLGMPEEDWHLIPEWSDALISSEASDPTEENLMAAALTLGAVHDYGAKIFEERRANPRNDVVSGLATAEIDGERLTVEEFCMFWLLLIVAGNETTRNSLSGGIIALLQRGLWKGLATDVAAGTSSIDQTVTDELIRFVSPVMCFRRTATRDLVLGGQHVRAGDKVVLWYGAANRDPQVFADPHELDLDRDPNPHLGFGIGPHFCLGTRLARLQISTMLTELLVRFPDLHLDGDPTYVGSTFINGVERLPVKVGTR